MRPLIFIDTEFNGHGGRLISMALVCRSCHFYEVLELGKDVKIEPWVQENVIPVLRKDAVSRESFQEKLGNFLRYQFHNGFTIMADWPDDVKHFCESLIVSPGKMISIPSFSAEVDRHLSSTASLVPHNALEDANSIRDSWLFKYYGVVKRYGYSEEGEAL